MDESSRSVLPASTRSEMKSGGDGWDWAGFREGLKVWLPVGLLGALALGVAWMFVEPAPPSEVTMSTGSVGGAYASKGERYAASFGRSGVSLVLEASAGSSENVERLLSGEADVALVQAGTVPAGAEETLEAVVAVAYEPLLVFVREGEGESAAEDGTLGALAGKRVAVGSEGSGTAALVETLLSALGLEAEAEATGTELVRLGGREAAAALKSGEVDAACFVMDPEGALVLELLSEPGLALLDLRRSAAWSHRLSYLEAVTLDEGVVDPVANLPVRDVRTVAPAAYLAVRKDTHRAVVQLLVEASKADAGRRSLIAPPGTFPSLVRMDLPVAKEAAFFFERGPNVLHRLFPFWLASLIDRLIILVVPLLVVLIPLVKAAPPMLRWRVRRRIYRWYRQLRVIDDALGHADLPASRLRMDLEQLKELDDEVAETDVPLSYMEEFYNLRLHIAYMRERIDTRLGMVKRGVDLSEFAEPGDV